MNLGIMDIIFLAYGLGIFLSTVLLYRSGVANDETIVVRHNKIVFVLASTALWIPLIFFVFCKVAKYLNNEPEVKA